MEFAVDSSASKTPGPFRCILIRNAIAEWTVDNCTSPLKLDKQIRKEGTYRLDIFVSSPPWASCRMTRAFRVEGAEGEKEGHFGFKVMDY